MRPRCSETSRSAPRYTGTKQRHACGPSTDRGRQGPTPSSPTRVMNPTISSKPSSRRERTWSSHSRAVARPSGATTNISARSATPSNRSFQAQAVQTRCHAILQTARRLHGLNQGRRHHDMAEIRNHHHVLYAVFTACPGSVCDVGATADTLPPPLGKSGPQAFKNG